ncbi:argininosuccinate lyase [Nioella nitratireducens]|uniref:argininosuccinate lyase n=1 Tax=Nioella nitratireducens TaxID=1287720 RepID=UPI0008FD3B87|nr:argininosuccinate lyase [Nioella nitratireducens]
MIRLITGLAAIALLSACGVDGAPTHPERRPAPATTGVSISGTVEMGVSGSL